MDVRTENLPISSIMVVTRIRKDVGAIEELADDIKERGLINPITVMDVGDGSYQLIAGLRRMDAYKRLGHTTVWATILSPMAADEALKMEYSENVQRKDFTVIEQLEYAEKIMTVEKAMAHERQAMYAGGRDHEKPFKTRITDNGVLTGKCPEVPKGESRERIAKKAGFTSSRQHQRALRVAVERPELLAKIDSGEETISGAFRRITNEKMPDPPQTTEDTKAQSDKKQSTDQVVHAGHDRLMKNPLYAELWDRHKKAVADANTAATELKIRSQGYENRLRNYQENVNALSRRCEVLEQENAALREQCAQRAEPEDKR